MQTSRIIFGAFLFAFMVTACDEGGKKSSAPRTDQVNNNNDTDRRDDEGRRENPPEAPITAECDAAWQKVFNGVEVGMSKAYEATSSTSGGVLGTTNMKRTWKETVKKIEPNAISVERTERSILPTETPDRTITSTMTRDDQCRAMMSDANDAVPTSEVLAERIEKVTTAAGTFDTKYVKTRQTGSEDGSEYEYINEAWVRDGTPEVLVKAITNWKTTMNGKPYEQSTTLELTELHLP